MARIEIIRCSVINRREDYALYTLARNKEK